MTLERGEPHYLGEQEAAIASWFGESLDQTTRFRLTP
jgi:hypothetical protein